MRAGRLRREGALDLSVDHRLLDSAEEVLGLAEPQPQGVGGHGAAFQDEHLTDFRRLTPTTRCGTRPCGGLLYETAAPRQGEVLALNIADLGPGAAGAP